MCVCVCSTVCDSDSFIIRYRDTLHVTLYWTETDKGENRQKRSSM